MQASVLLLGFVAGKSWDIFELFDFLDDEVLALPEAHDDAARAGGSHGYARVRRWFIGRGHICPTLLTANIVLPPPCFTTRAR